MKQYLGYFKLRFIASLQYRTAAIAGILTQFFFGFVFVMVYVAFYESNNTEAPMQLKELVTYIWLGQAFYSLTYLYYKDKEIINMIRSGDIAYELCRPGNLYFKWYIKIMASKLSAVTLKFLPVILLTLFLPEPFNLSAPISLIAFLGFIISFTLSIFLIPAFITLIHLISFFLLDEKGIYIFIISFSEIFAGLVIPLPFFPKILLNIANILPFRYISDLAFRLYTGNISMLEAPKLILIQLIWTIVFIIGGYLLNKRITKAVVVQGG